MTAETADAAAPAFSEARVSARAVEANTRRFASLCGGHGVMAVLTADAFGHGALQAAAAAVAGGATWLATARLDDAIALRRGGRREPIVFWQLDPFEDLAPAAELGLIPAVSSTESLQRVVAAGIRSLHLVVESGAGAPGIDPARWAELVASTVEPQRSGKVDAVGIMDWSGDAPSGELGRAVAAALQQGLVIDVVHSDGAPGGPRDSTVSVVRAGAVLFGLSEQLGPAPDGFVPAMTLSAAVLGLKAAEAGVGVSYGYTYRTRERTTLALVSLGYGDGIDRAAGNRAPIMIGDRTLTISGRVAMDASVVDVGDLTTSPGDRAVFFGDPAAGHPTAQQWGSALGVPSAAITATLTARVQRIWS